MNVSKRFDAAQEGQVAIARFPHAIDVRVVFRNGAWTLHGKPFDVEGAVMELQSATRVDFTPRVPDPERVEAERAWAAAIIPPPSQVTPDHGERPTRIASPARVSKAAAVRIAAYAEWYHRRIPPVYTGRWNGPGGSK